MALFDKAVELVLRHEGGYTPGLPDDPGGATNMGISQKAHPALDIPNLTRAQALEIYHHNYWTLAMEHLEDQSLANCQLDCAVNQGPGALQNLLAKVITPSLHDFQVARLLRYVSTVAQKPEQFKYLANWFRRTLDV